MYSQFSLISVPVPPLSYLGSYRGNWRPERKKEAQHMYCQLCCISSVCSKKPSEIKPTTVYICFPQLKFSEKFMIEKRKLFIYSLGTVQIIKGHHVEYIHQVALMAK